MIDLTCVVCDICGRPATADRWCGEGKCPAHWAGIYPGADLALACCYRLGMERQKARAEKAEARFAEASDQADKLVAVRDYLRAELARLTTWHPASEVPDTERCVLGWDGDDVYFVMFRGGVWFAYKPTHWRELPPGPEVTV